MLVLLNSMEHLHNKRASERKISVFSSVSFNLTLWSTFTIKERVRERERERKISVFSSVSFSLTLWSTFTIKDE